MAIARPNIVLPNIEQLKIVPLNILHIRDLVGNVVWFCSNVITTLVPDNRAVGLEVAKAGFQFAEVEICKLATHPSLQPSWVLSGALAYLRVFVLCWDTCPEILVGWWGSCGLVYCLPANRGGSREELRQGSVWWHISLVPHPIQQVTFYAARLRG